MKTLLRIDSSLRTEGSYSRNLADYFQTMWKTVNPAGKVIHRDLVKKEIPHITNSTIAGFYAAKEDNTSETVKATALSDELIAELKSSDEVLISSPMYNCSIASTLKAYIDYVFRINHTFQYVNNECHGLLNNKKVFIITVKVGLFKGTKMERYEFQNPYLKSVLELMGMKVEYLLSLEGTSNREIAEKNKTTIENTINSIFSIKM
ncbi:MAG: NAD(P)H-dependent oxidoreductase [Rhizobacter sp.]|nr:NAD(P)H-dependent oxidoreductase [Ferruginibacter sp.]